MLVYISRFSRRREAGGEEPSHACAAAGSDDAERRGKLHYVPLK